MHNNLPHTVFLLLPTLRTMISSSSSGSLSSMTTGGAGAGARREVPPLSTGCADARRRFGYIIVHVESMFA